MHPFAHGKPFLIVVAAAVALGISGVVISYVFADNPPPPRATAEIVHSAQATTAPTDPYADWQRPAGPIRIALQAGHWKNSEVPPEQDNLRFNNMTAGGYAEWKVALAIAQEAKRLLDATGEEFEVEILPTTVPPAYFADAFVSIHADSNPNRAMRGYKVASARRDRSGAADRLAALVAREYAAESGLPRDGGLTSAMRGYYAFNWCKYEHSLHPMTPATIIETGFLSNAADREVIARNPALAARGIADGILAYLRGEAPDHDELAAVTTVPDYIRQGERERDAAKRAAAEKSGETDPSSLIAPNANAPDDPWCQPRRPDAPDDEEQRETPANP